jgi:Ca2+-binding EF-hand superfamily protein
VLQYDLDDNGKLDSNEFVRMLATLGADVSRTEAEAAMEVRHLAYHC